MSYDVDERVVEMRFDNEQFESGAKETLSTLDKLKQALNFSGASKGIDNLSNSVNKVSFNPIVNALDSVRLGFSKLDVARIRVIQNIVDDVQRAGTALLKNLTIDQVTAGWNKYAEKTSSVQTIMAATANQFNDTATQMAYVNDQLDKLNWFTDETSYNFVDMVGNIGKFTANNIDLETSVTAMQGIATWAAKSGANATEASRAMYNLSQAISVGSVKLIDWKSIENANMATAEFKQNVIETAVELGYLKANVDGTFETLDKATPVSISNFNSALSEGWFSAEVLLKTLSKYGGFTNDLYEAYEKTGLTATELLQTIESYKNGTLDIARLADSTGASVSSLTNIMETLSSTTNELGESSFRAAQEAKTFEEAINATKDAVSTGWMNTFEIIFGDYEFARVLWTDLANEMYDVFASGAEARNELLKGALGARKSGWEELLESVEESGASIEDFESAVIRAARAHGIAIDDMIAKEGDFNSTLQLGWANAEILNDAMTELIGSLDATSEMTGISEFLEKLANKGFASTEDAVKAATDANVDYWKSLALVEEYANKKWNVGNVSINDLSSIISDPSEANDMLNRIEKLKDYLVRLQDEGFVASGEAELEAAANGYKYKESLELVSEYMKYNWSLNDLGLKHAQSLLEISASEADMAEKTLELAEAFGALGDVTGSLGNPWKMITNGIEEFGGSASDFQNELIDVAKAHDVAIDDLIERYGSFEESLQSGWATTELISEALNNLANEAEDAGDSFLNWGISSSMQDTISVLEELKNGIEDETVARNLATEANLDYEKTLELIASYAKKGWRISNIGADDLQSIMAYNDETQDLIGKVNEAASVLENMKNGMYEDVEAFNDLIAAGWDYDRVLTTLKKYEKYGFDFSTVGLSDIQYMMAYSEVSQDTAEGYRHLAETASEANSELSFLILQLENGAELSGRDLLFAGISDVWNSLKLIFGEVREAWENIFPPKTSEELYNIIQGMQKFTSALRSGVIERLDKVSRTFSGLFSILGLGRDLFNEIGKSLGRFISNVFGKFNVDILGFTANVGDALTEFSEWVKANELIAKSVAWVNNKTDETVAVVKEYINAFLSLPRVQSAIQAVRTEVNSWLSDLKTRLPSITSFIERFRNTFTGLKDATPQDLINWAKELKDAIVSDISALVKTLTGKYPKIGEFFEKILNFIQEVKRSISDFFQGKSDSILGGKSLGELFGSLFDDASNKIGDAKENISDSLNSFGTMVSDKLNGIFGKTEDSVDDGIKNAGRQKSNVQGFFDELLSGSTVVSGVISALKQATNLGQKIAIVLKAIGNGILTAINWIRDKSDEAWALVVGNSLLVGLGWLIKKIFDVINPTNKLIDSISGIGEKIGSVIGSFSGIGRQIKGTLRAYKSVLRSEAIKNIAESILILASSLWVISKIPVEDLDRAIGVIFVLASLLVAIQIFTNKLGTTQKLWEKNSSKWSFLSAGLGLIAAVYALKMVIEAISELKSLVDPFVTGEDKWISLGVTIGIIAAIMTMFIALSKHMQGVKAGAGVSIFLTLLSMKMLIGMIDDIAAIDLKTIGDNLGSFVVIILAIVGLMAATRLAGNNAGKAGVALLLITISMGIMVGLIKLISTMKWEGIKKGIIGIGFLTAFIAALVWVTSKAGGGKQILAIGGMMLMLSTSMAILVGVIAIIGHMKNGVLAKGLLVVGLLAAFVAGLMVVSKYATGAWKTVLAMTVVIVALAGVVMLMTTIDPLKMAIATGILSVLMLMFGVMAKLAGNANASIKTMVLVTVAIGILAGIVFLLSKYSDTDKAVKSAAALVLAAIAFAAICAALTLVNKFSTARLWNTVGVAAVAAVAIAALSGIMILLEKNIDDPDKLLKILGDLEIMILEFAEVMAMIVILQKLLGATNGRGAFTTTWSVVGTAMTVIAGIGAFAVALGAIVTKWPNLMGLLDTGIEVGYKIGEFVTSFIGGGIAGITLGLDEAGKNIEAFFDNSEGFFTWVMGNADEFKTAITAFSEAFVDLGKHDLYEGLASLFGGRSHGFVLGENGQLEKAEKDISTFATMSEGLPELGTNLSLFATNAETFIATMGDESGMQQAIDTIPKFIELLNELGKQDFKDAWREIFSFGQSNKTSLTDLGNDIGGLGAGLNKFATDGSEFFKLLNGRNYDLSKLTVFSEMARQLADINAIYGTYNSGDMSASFLAFGTAIAGFGLRLKEFSKNLGDTDIESITQAATVLSNLANLYTLIPDVDPINGGGAGELGDFGTSLATLGTALSQFKESVKDIQGGSFDQVIEAINALDGLELKTSGGLWSLIVGDNSFGTFGENLAKLGTGVANFFDNTKEVTRNGQMSSMLGDIDWLIRMQNGLVAYGGYGTIGSFIDALPAYGTNISTFFGDVSSVTDLIGFDNAMAMIEGLCTITESHDLSDVDSKTSDLKTASNKFKTIGDNLSKYYGKISGMTDANVVANARLVLSSVVEVIESMSGLSGLDPTTAIQNVTAFVSGLSEIDTSTAEAFSANLSSIVSTAISNMAVEIQNGSFTIVTAVTEIADGVYDLLISYEVKYEEAGKTDITQLSEGMKSAGGSVTSAGQVIARKAINAINAFYGTFRTSGIYLGRGFVSGLNSQTGYSYNAGYTLGRSALSGLNDSLDIHSPSREAGRSAMYTGAGFVNELIRYAHYAYGAGSEFGDQVMDGMNAAMAEVYRYVGDTFDFDPVIRPTVDLSQMTASARAISDMFQTSVRTSMDGAYAARSVIGRRSEVEGGGSVDGDSKTGNTYTFNQYNTSPKALSRTEIYRDTRNLFAAAKSKLGG